MDNSNERNPITMISGVNGISSSECLRSPATADTFATKDMEREAYPTRNVNELQKKGSFTENVNYSSFVNETDCNLNVEVNDYEELLNNNVPMEDNNYMDNSVEIHDESYNSAEMEKVQEEIVCDAVLKSLKNQLCRLCGRKQTSLLPIFGSHLMDEVPVSEKIQMHLPLEVKANDILPQNICLSCNSMVRAWHDLHVSCVAADLALRRMFVETSDSISTACHSENLGGSNVYKSLQSPDKLS